MGSMLYLIPIFLSLYLKVLEMKHSMSKTSNAAAKKFYDQAEAGVMPEAF